MLQSAILGAEGVPVNNGWELLHVDLTPTHISHLPIHMYRWVIINCSNFGGLETLANKNSSTFYIITIKAQNSHVAIPFSSNDLYPDDNRTDVLYLMTEDKQQVTFAVKAVHIGKTALTIKVHDAALAIPFSTFSPGEVDMGDIMHYIDLEDIMTDITLVLAQVEYHVTVIRKLRLVDMGFDCVMVAMAMLNSFGMGCLTDWTSLRMHLLHPTSLLLAACCQFIILPTVSSPNLYYTLLISVCSFSYLMQVNHNICKYKNNICVKNI